MSQTFIDLESHPVVASMEELLPYMEEGWADRFRRTRFVLPAPQPHPGSDQPLNGTAVPTDPVEAARAIPDDVRAALLIPAQVLPAAGWCDHALSAVFASAVNQLLVERWLPADARFRLAIGVAPHDPDLAAAEIRRLGSHPGVAAVCTSVISQNLGQRHYEPIFAAAHELGLPVVFHPGGSEGLALGAATLGGVGPRTSEERHALLPQVAAVNILSLIFDGVFSRLPELRVVFAGFGFDWAVGLLWHADMEWRALRIDVPWVTKEPSEYAADHIRLVVDDRGAGPLEHVQNMVANIPETMLVYGSDRPFSHQPAASVLEAVPERIRDRVARGNAEALLAGRI